MLKTYVQLNRPVGITDKRADDGFEYEMLVPIKTDNGYSPPPHCLEYFSTFAFIAELNAGKTVLVNSRGGWCLLSKTDHIISIYQKEA